jgi:carbamoyl-phosphate synthase large subunit
VFAAHIDTFHRVGTRLLVSSPSAIQTCQDKRLFVRMCQRLNFPVPLTCSPTERPARWPVFVRPNRGAGGLGATRIDDQSALDHAQASVNGDLLVQELVSSPEYSVDVLSDFEGLPLQAVVRRRLHIRAGESVVSQVECRPKLEAMSLQLCGAIGLIGHSVVQAFDDDLSGPRFIEVNPRFGGASSLSIVAGLDSPLRLLALLRGDPSAREARPIRQGLSTLRFSQDLLVERANLEFPPLEAG